MTPQMLALHAGGAEQVVPSTPGAFAWWYVDLVANDGRRLVLIWSFGLPFLPGYVSASRAGIGQDPHERPSVNVALYDGEETTLYLLQEVAADRASARGGRVALGDCTFESVERAGRREVVAVLDCPIPGTSDRLTGTVRASGPAVRPDLTSDGAHRWTPLLAASIGTATLSIGRRALAPIVGAVYHDRNVSEVPLERLGIAAWLWGRVRTTDGELVWYVAWPEHGGDPEAVVLEVDARGSARVSRPEVTLGEVRRAWFGMGWWARVKLDLPDGRQFVVLHDAVLDDGPFYLRLGTRLEGADGPGTAGTGEILAPSRVDRARERPLVRMAVHAVDGPNSMWLPLFCGPRATRVERLFAGWFGWRSS